MFIRAVFVSVLVVAVLHCVAGADQCNLNDSVGRLIQSCQALKECPIGWQKNEESNSCYKVFRDNLSWSAARTKCQSFEGADLASLTTKEELGYAFDYISSGGWSSPWIGLERDGTGWRWLDGNTLTIESKGFWHPNEPNNLGGEDVAEMYDNGLINDISSVESNHKIVLCEMTL